MFRTCDQPGDLFRRYLIPSGDYPINVGLRTPIGKINLELFSHDDVLTLNEVFCRQDYMASESDEVFVDWGSNIGISAAYFLTRSRRSYAYLFEPLPQNIARLRSNLATFSGRFSVTDAAVGLIDGTVHFGWEPTGRYGGIGLDTALSIHVPCVDSNRALQEVIASRGHIDVLKIDIENLETNVVKRITPSIASKIKKIYVEGTFRSPRPLRETHAYRRRGWIACFVNVAGKVT